MGSRDLALLVATLALWASACSAQRLPADLPTATATISRADVELMQIRVAIAENEKDRNRGLKGIESLDDDEGMVFLYDSPTVTPFYMRDTLMPLQLASWNERGEIVSIIRMQPCTKEPCHLYETGLEIFGALEVNAGALDKAGVRVGDQISITRDARRDRR